MAEKKFSVYVRKWSRSIHRDLSFLFSGVLLIYAISGFMLNHKKDWNSDYIIRQQELQFTEGFPTTPNGVTREFASSLLKKVNETGNYLKHYSPADRQIKIFIKGGSTMTVDTESGKAVYESIKKRPVLSAFNRLHYNPTRWWTIFSDIFILALVIIVLSGLIMVKGPKGLWGRGGIELIIGMLIPLAFILIS